MLFVIHFISLKKFYITQITELLFDFEPNFDRFQC